MRLSRSVRFANGSESVLELNMQRRRSIRNGNTNNWRSSSTFCRRHRIWSFHVVFLQRTAKKCSEIYNARALPLFCSLNLFFWWRSRCRRRGGLFKLPSYRDVFAFEKLRSQNVSRSHENEKPAFWNFSGLKSVFEKLRCRDGLVWTVVLSVELKLRFQVALA